jgi:hypothetical protein
MENQLNVKEVVIKQAGYGWIVTLNFECEHPSREYVATNWNGVAEIISTSISDYEDPLDYTEKEQEDEEENEETYATDAEETTKDKGEIPTKEELENAFNALTIEKKGRKIFQLFR